MVFCNCFPKQLHMSMRFINSALLGLLLVNISFGQQLDPANSNQFLAQRVPINSGDSINEFSRNLPDNQSPYTLKWKTETAIIASSVAVNFLGFKLIQNKSDLTLAQLANKKKDNLFFMDKWVAGNYSEKADKDSYILFNGSYIYPLAIMLLDKKQQQKFGQLAILYVETIGITGSMYTLTAGLVYRSRPFVYGTIAPEELRLSKGAQRSFYGGHVATTAALSFFTAKVFADFHPNSKARPYVWTAAAILPAIMAYERARAGYHFVTDSMLSYAIGAATGYLVPQLHKNKNLQNISVQPAIVGGAQGLAVVYHLK